MRIAVAALVVAFALPGCAGMSKGACTAVVGLGAKALANYDGTRLNLSPEQIKVRERGYEIAALLAAPAFCEALTDTIFGKLKEGGKKEREAALVAAAEKGTNQSYSEPTDPTLKGSVTPSKKYVDQSKNRECVDMEEELADASKSEKINSKVCRESPDSGYKPVTS